MSKAVNEPNIVTEVLSPGKIAYASGFEPTEEYSAAAENQILFGDGMKRGTKEDVQAKLWDGASATDKFLGFALYSTSGTLADSPKDVIKGYVKYDSVLWLKRGFLWVEVSASGTEPAVGDNVTVMPDGKIAKRVTVAGSSGKYGAQVTGRVEKIATYNAKKYAILYVDNVSTPENIQV